MINKFSKKLICFIACLITITFNACNSCDSERLSQSKIDYEVVQSVDFKNIFGTYSKNININIENTGAVPLRFKENEIRNETGPAELSISPLNFELKVRETKNIVLHLQAENVQGGLLKEHPYSSTILFKNAAGQEKNVSVNALILEKPRCDDQNPCTQDIFDGQKCTFLQQADGSTCDDQNACTLNNKCVSGQCLGKTLNCSDNQACTADSCNKDFGCVFEEVDSRCETQDLCKDATCSATFGCQENAKEEGALCSFDGCAEIGLCFAGFCSKQQVPDGFPCDDGNVCSKGDTCQQGECASGDETEFTAQPSELLVQGYQNVNVENFIWPTHYYDSYQYYQAIPEKVLDTSELTDGRFRVIWQSSYFLFTAEPRALTGIMCDWREYQNAYLSPFKNNDRHNDAPEEQPNMGTRSEEDACLSAIFISDIMPNNEVRTHQVALTAGPNAANIEKNINYFGTESIALVVTAPNGQDLYISHYQPEILLNYEAPYWNKYTSVHNYSYTYAPIPPFGTNDPQPQYFPSQVTNLSITQYKDKVSILGHWQFLEHFNSEEDLRHASAHSNIDAMNAKNEFSEIDNAEDEPPPPRIFTRAPMFLLHYDIFHRNNGTPPTTAKLGLKGFTFEAINEDINSTLDIPVFQSQQLKVQYDSKNTEDESDDQIHIAVLSPNQTGYSGRTPFFTPYLYSLRPSELNDNFDPVNVPFTIIDKSLFNDGQFEGHFNRDIFAFNFKDLNENLLAFRIREIEDHDYDGLDISLAALRMQYDQSIQKVLIKNKYLLNPSSIMSENIFSTYHFRDQQQVKISYLRTTEQSYYYLQYKDLHQLFPETSNTFDTQNLTAESQTIFKPIVQNWDYNAEDHKNGMNITASHIHLNQSPTQYNSAIEIQRFSCKEQPAIRQCWTDNDCNTDDHPQSACLITGPDCDDNDIGVSQCEGQCIVYQECPISPEAILPDVNINTSPQPVPFCNIDETLYSDTVTHKWRCGLDQCPFTEQNIRVRD